MYYVYMLECENKSLYTGITSDIARRFSEHCDTKKTRKGAKYTRSFKPIRIVAVFSARNRSKASSIEANIKKLDRKKKIEIINVYNIEHDKKPDRLYVSSTSIKSFFA